MFHVYGLSALIEVRKIRIVASCNSFVRLIYQDSMTDIKSFMYRKSTGNQRIEALLVDK